MAEQPAVGGTRPSVALERAYELLADGKWHDFNKILVAVSAAVEPSKAFRGVAKRRKRPVPEDPEIHAAMVRTGQREMAYDIFQRKERFERRVTAEGVKQIRLLPFSKPTKEQQSVLSKRGWETRRRKAQNEQRD